MTKEQGRAAATGAAPEQIEMSGLFTMMLGVWYPTHYLVAAIDPAEGPAAVEALLAAGFDSNSIRLDDGARVGQIREAIYQQAHAAAARRSLSQPSADR